MVLTAADNLSCPHRYCQVVPWHPGIANTAANTSTDTVTSSQHHTATVCSVRFCPNCTKLPVKHIPKVCVIRTVVSQAARLSQRSLLSQHDNSRPCATCLNSDHMQRRRRRQILNKSKSKSSKTRTQVRDYLSLCKSGLKVHKSTLRRRRRMIRQDHPCTQSFRVMNVRFH